MRYSILSDFPMRQFRRTFFLYKNDECIDFMGFYTVSLFLTYEYKKCWLLGIELRIYENNAVVVISWKQTQYKINCAALSHDCWGLFDISFLKCRDVLQVRTSEDGLNSRPFTISLPGLSTTWNLSVRSWKCEDGVRSGWRTGIFGTLWNKLRTNCFLGGWLCSYFWG